MLSLGSSFSCSAPKEILQFLQIIPVPGSNPTELSHVWEAKLQVLAHCLLAKYSF